jgi:hypothetical protein
MRWAATSFFAFGGNFRDCVKKLVQEKTRGVLSGILGEMAVVFSAGGV